MPKRRTSPAEDIIDITSWFPWWVGCLLALLSFAILHYCASIQIPPPTGQGQIGNFVGKQLWLGLAKFGQFVLPPLFLIGALASFFTRKIQQRRYAHVQQQSQQSSLNTMSWQQFEGLVAEFFRRRGYAVQQTGGDGPDGGVDLVLKKGSDTYLVQCKQWKAYKVGVQPVRELYGVMAARGAAGGFVITSGEFSAEAKAFARGLNIQLFDGARLHQLIREARAIRESPLRDPTPAAPAPSPPACPQCGQAMVKRRAKQGAQVGKEFWGCSAYPACRGTMNC